MFEILKLHCGIVDCNTHYEYKQNNKDIIAISAQWRNEESKGGDWAGLLAKQPKIGEKYELNINFPLKIDLNHNFWVVYFEPYTEHEGLESELGINSMLFCLCQTKKIIDVEKSFANIEIEVIAVKKIEEDNSIKIEINKRTEFLDEEINSNSVSTENFQNFSIIQANYQSDCGWTYIIEKKNGKSKIIAENHWHFHENIWLLSNEELTIEQEKKYGIQ